MTKKPDILLEEESKSKVTENTKAHDAGLVRSSSPQILRGCVDMIVDNTIYGTAWDASGQSRSPDVEVYDAETLLGRVTADRYRRDQELLGIGDGHHGFEFVLPPAVDPDAVRVVFCDTDIALQKGPFFRAVLLSEESGDDAVKDQIDELKNTLAMLERKIDSTLPTLGGLEAQFGAFSDRAKLLAVRQDLGQIHDSLMTPITNAREKIDEISQAGTRIEGFLNIELGKRIAKEFDIDGLNSRIQAIDTRLRRARYGRLVTVFLILGLAAAFAYSLPIDWQEELRRALPWLFGQRL